MKKENKINQQWQIKIRWKENYKKECWEIKIPKSFPMAQIIKEDNVPALMEYNSERNSSGNLWTTRERMGKLNILEIGNYWFFYGYLTLKDIIRKKYNIENRYFEILEEVEDK